MFYNNKYSVILTIVVLPEMNAERGRLANKDKKQRWHLYDLYVPCSLYVVSLFLFIRLINSSHNYTLSMGEDSLADKLYEYEKITNYDNRDTYIYVLNDGSSSPF